MSKEPNFNATDGLQWQSNTQFSNLNTFIFRQKLWGRISPNSITLQEYKLYLSFDVGAQYQ